VFHPLFEHEMPWTAHKMGPQKLRSLQGFHHILGTERESAPTTTPPNGAERGHRLRAPLTASLSGRHGDFARSLSSGMGAISTAAVPSAANAIDSERPENGQQSTLRTGHFAVAAGYRTTPSRREQIAFRNRNRERPPWCVGPQPKRGPLHSERADFRKSGLASNDTSASVRYALSSEGAHREWKGSHTPPPQKQTAYYTAWTAAEQQPRCRSLSKHELRRFGGRRSVDGPRGHGAESAAERAHPNRGSPTDSEPNVSDKLSANQQGPKSSKRRTEVVVITAPHRATTLHFRCDAI